jgi:hypothetical protein
LQLGCRDSSHGIGQWLAQGLFLVLALVAWMIAG